MSTDPGELERAILDLMATQSVGRLGMPLNVIRAGLPRTSDRLTDRALERLTRLDRIEVGPVAGMRRLVDHEVRAISRQNQAACRSATVHVRVAPAHAGSARDGARPGSGPLLREPSADPIGNPIWDLIALARAPRPDADPGRAVDRDHVWDEFGIFDRPYPEDVPLEVQALTEARGWPRHLARAMTRIGGAVVRRVGDVVREHAGSSDDQLEAAARRAQDQRRWLAYLAQVRNTDRQPDRTGPA